MGGERRAGPEPGGESGSPSPYFSSHSLSLSLCVFGVAGGNPVNVIGGRRGNSAGEKASRAESLCGGGGGRSHHRHATKEQSLPMSSAIERKSLDPSE